MHLRKKIAKSNDVHLVEHDQQQGRELPVEIWFIIFHDVFSEDYDEMLSIRLTCELFKGIADLISLELIRQLSFRSPQWQSEQLLSHSHSALFLRTVKNENKRLCYANELIKKLDIVEPYDGLPYTPDTMKHVQLNKMQFRLFFSKSQEIINEASRVVRNIDFDSTMVTTNDRYMFPKDLGAYLMSAVNLRAYEALAVLLALVQEEYANTISLKRIRGAIFYEAAASYQDFELERLFQYVPIININRRICFRYPHDYFAGSFTSVQTNRYERLLDVAVRYQNQSAIDYLQTLGANESPRQTFR